MSRGWMVTLSRWVGRLVGFVSNHVTVLYCTAWLKVWIGWYFHWKVLKSWIYVGVSEQYIHLRRINYRNVNWPYQSMQILLQIFFTFIHSFIHSFNLFFLLFLSLFSKRNLGSKYLLFGLVTSFYLEGKNYYYLENSCYLLHTSIQWDIITWLLSIASSWAEGK